MRTWPLCLIALPAVLSLGLASHGSQNNDAQDAGGSSFGNKIILLELKGGYASALKAAQVKKLGDRPFVVGTSLRDSPLTREVYPGRVVWLPLSDVEQIVEFDDLAQMRKASTDRENGVR